MAMEMAEASDIVWMLLYLIWAYRSLREFQEALVGSQGLTDPGL